MSDTEVYQRLRAETMAMLGYDPAKLTGLESTIIDLVCTVRLEIDAAQAQQQAGQPIDISRLADMVRILKSLLPSAPLATAHEPDFSDALPTFERIINAQRGAIAAREEHLSEIYAKEIVELKATISALHDQLADAKYLDMRPTIPPPPQATSSQPPLPPPLNTPPANYLKGPSEPWCPFVDENGIHTPTSPGGGAWGPAPGGPGSKRAW
jgi:hypothetical protein